MFHTPPTNPNHEVWSSETALKNSYFSSYEPEAEATEIHQISTVAPQLAKPAEPVVPGAKDDSNTMAKDAILPTEEPATIAGENTIQEAPKLDDTLPPQLQRELDNFAKFLKEPRFTKPLSMYDIANLFQKFYLDFNEKSVRFVKGGLPELKLTKRRSRVSSIPLLDPNEIAMKKSQEKLNSVKIHHYNLLIEKLACKRFYDSILVPKSGLPTDLAELQINEMLNKKLGILFKMNVSLKSLDIELPVEEEFFICKLDEAVIPQFVTMAVETSPICKLRCLYRVHEEISEVVKAIQADSEASSSASSSSSKQLHMNTDLYLPVLIFCIMNLRELHKIDIYQQLQFIKRFKNEVFFETGLLDEHDDGSSNERGELLYVLTNLEASIMYLGSCTAENLSLEVTSDILDELDPEAVLLDDDQRIQRHAEILELLAKPISFEAASVSPTPTSQHTRSRRPSKQSSNSGSRKSSFSNVSEENATTVPANSSRFSLLNGPADFSLYNADQGLRTISTAVDSSFRSILGRFSSTELPSWTAVSAHHDPNEISEETKSQIEESLQSMHVSSIGENNAKQEQTHDQKITPTSSISTTSTVNSGGNHSLNSTGSNTVRPPPIAILPEKSEPTTFSTIPLSPANGDRFTAFNKITSSVNGVMKNFRPLSASSSSTSLSNNLETSAPLFETVSPNRQGNSRSRSRTASFMSSSIFGGGQPASNSSAPTLNSVHRSSLFGTIENAIEKTTKTRSRGNSMLSDPGREIRASDADTASVSTGDLSSAIVKLEPDLKQLNRFENKEFTELSVSELNEMFNNYKLIMDRLQ